MLSYKHAFHAGNPADIHKHLLLAGLLRLLTAKDRPICYMETHAGRGLYDLGGSEALKTGEATTGARRAELGGTALGEVLARMRAEHGADAYPGSPLIASELLRAQDRMVLMELHPSEYPALKALLGRRAEIHDRDGLEGVMALCPPTPRRGLVLVDPSYEVKTEYAQVVEFAQKLRRRWPEAVLAIWYPVLEAGRHRALLEGTGEALVSEAAFDMGKGRGMTGSGMILVNAPYGTEELQREVAAAGRGVFSVLQ